QGIELMLRNCGEAAVNPIRTLRRIGPRCSKDRAPTRQNSAHRVQVEGHGVVINNAAPSLQKAHDFVAVMKDSLAHNCSYDSIQPGTVASARQHADFHRLLL